MFPELLLSTFEPHHISIAPARRFAQKALAARHAKGGVLRFSKKEVATITATMLDSEQAKIYDGINFSRIQIPTILSQRSMGIPMGFETLGPYLSNYLHADGIMTLDNLTNEDAIGLKLARLFRGLFPDAHLVSLYDDYNRNNIQQDSTVESSFNPAMIQNFHASLEDLFRSQRVILPAHEAGKDFFLLSEAARVMDADTLVRRLSTHGYIQRKGQAIIFVNNDAENPLYRYFYLRTRQGRWLCEALDAAAFLSEQNLSIVRIVALPDYMRPQQDKVWEILRVLGMQPSRYHNIFFDPLSDPYAVAVGVSKAFAIFEDIP